MPTERFFTAMTILLVGVSVASSSASLYFYHLALMDAPEPAGSRADIDGFDVDLLSFDESPLDVDDLVSLILSHNATVSPRS